MPEMTTTEGLSRPTAYITSPMPAGIAALMTCVKKAAIPQM